MAEIIKKYLGTEAVQQLIDSTRAEIASGDSKALSDAKAYANGLNEAMEARVNAINEVPETTMPHQQLVTDGEGNAVWETREFYDESRTLYSGHPSIAWTYAKLPFVLKEGVSYNVSIIDEENDTERVQTIIAEGDEYGAVCLENSDYTFLYNPSENIVYYTPISEELREGESDGDPNEGSPFVSVKRIEVWYANQADAGAVTLPERFLPTTVPVIQSATVGQTVVVKAVDTEGKPTEWEMWDAAEDAATKADAALASAKEYADDLASNYDAAGTATTKVNELANGQVKTNTDAIAILNGDATTAGSVDKKIADAKTELNTTIGAVEDKADAAQADADALEIDMGNVDDLSTNNKTVVGAINEVLAAVGTGGTAAVVTITTDTTSDGALKSYTVKQGSSTVGVIDIPKDMVVQSGEVVTDPEGREAGTYIKLVLANATNDEIYVNVGTLVDIYKAKADADQVQVAIDPSTREISAAVVADSITSTELATGAVTSGKIAYAAVTSEKIASKAVTGEKIADEAVYTGQIANSAVTSAKIGPGAVTSAKIGPGAVTTDKFADFSVTGIVLANKAVSKAKLSDELQASIDKADGAAADAQTKADAALDAAKEYADQAEADAVSTAATDATTKANTAETNAKAHADGLNTAMGTRVAALESVSYVEITADEINAMFA